MGLRWIGLAGGVLLLCMPGGTPVAATDRAYSEQEALTEAILDLAVMTRNGRRVLRWRVCDEVLRTPQEKRQYAEKMASWVLEAAEDDLNPFLMVAQLAQESSLRPCALSTGAYGTYRASLGRQPTQRDILRLVKNKKLQQKLGIKGMDVGLAQFRIPGFISRQVGVEDPSELLDAEAMITHFATALRYYKETCHERGHHMHRGRYERPGLIAPVRYAVPGPDSYWVHHNMSKGFNPKYYRNVVRRYAKTLKWRESIHGQNNG